MLHGDPCAMQPERNLAVFSPSKLLGTIIDLRRPLLIHIHRAMSMEVCHDYDYIYLGFIRES